MHHVAVWTRTPVEHAQRALDELARLGFTLHSLNVAASEPAASIRIAFSGADAMKAATFRARLTRIPGLMTAAPTPATRSGCGGAL